jgi:putative spermidine/putrescine transport system substrate-binding protein
MAKASKYIVAAAVVGLLSAPIAATAQTVLTYAGFGGTTQEAQVKYLFGDAAKLGITIREERSGFWTGIKAYLTSGAKGWDLTDIGFARAEEASKADLVLPLDYSIIDRSRVPAQFATDKYIGFYTFAYGIAYPKKKFGANPPRTWADFWDTKKFPGRRAIIADGTYAYEVALMADGVPMNEVYKTLKAPGGVDRALKKLEQLKPDVAVWWKSTGQATQLLHDGEAELVMIPNARAQSLVKEGMDIGFAWDQAIVDVNCFLVPKTAPHPKEAMKLINSALDPVNQAKFSAVVGYGPTNPKAFDQKTILSEEAIGWLPDVSKLLVADPDWYTSQQATEAYQRFGKFLQ